MVYDPTNTSLTTVHRQTLVELVLATASTPGLVTDVKTMVRRDTHAIYSSNLTLCVLQLVELANTFLTQQ
jgi:hypothetical protein